jgi:hypothetical protein
LGRACNSSIIEPRVCRLVRPALPSPAPPAPLCSRVRLRGWPRVTLKAMRLTGLLAPPGRGGRRRTNRQLRAAKSRAKIARPHLMGLLCGARGSKVNSLRTIWGRSPNVKRPALCLLVRLGRQTNLPVHFFAGRAEIGADKEAAWPPPTRTRAAAKPARCGPLWVPASPSSRLAARP